MSGDNYNPDSMDATVARIEQMLIAALAEQKELRENQAKLWQAHGRLSNRVAWFAGASAAIGGAVGLAVDWLRGK